MSAEEPDLNEILDAIKVTATQVGLNVYPRVADVVNSPALVVMPKGIDFNVSFNRGSDTYLFDMYVLVAMNDPVSAQLALNRLLSGKGDKSIRQMFFEHGDLGLPEGIADSNVEKMWGYDGKFKVSAIDYVGAALRLCVVTA